MQNIIQTLLQQSLLEHQETWNKKTEQPITDATILYGESGILDSFALVNWVLHIENIINQHFNTALVLTSEKAFSQRNSPFYSVATFTHYIQILLSESAHEK